MRNDLFVFKIFIPTPYWWQKKRILTEMTTRCHSLSLVVTCCHSLSLVVPLVVTSCYSLYHSLSFFATRYSHLLSVFLSAILGKHLQIIKRHLYVVYKMNALTKSKMFKENVEFCFNKLNL